jgi:hypothetical protein
MGLLDHIKIRPMSLTQPICDSDARYGKDELKAKNAGFEAKLQSPARTILVVD